MTRTILYVSSQTEMGGAQHSLLDIVRTLDAERYHPLAVISGEGELAGRLRESGIETAVIPFSTPLPFVQLANPLLWFRNAAALFRVSALVKRNSVSLIHCNDGASLYMVALARMVLRVPVVFHVRWFETGARKALVLIAARLLVDRFVTNSHAVRRYVQHELPQASRAISVVHNAVDVQKFHPSLPKNTLRSEFGIAEHRAIVGMVGRFIGWKNHTLIIKAAKRLQSEGITPMFCLTGSVQLKNFTPDAEQVHQTILSLVREEGLEGQVLLLGYRSDIERVVAGFDILICPSENEPFGRVVIEAMACGVPVVATDSGGIPEIITHGEDGLLVPVNDKRALADAIKRLLSDKELYNRVRLNGRTTVEQRFSLQHLKEGIERVYEEMLLG